MQDGELAARLAKEAGAILLQLRSSSACSGKALGDAGDALAHEFIAAALGAERPDDGFLSEECVDDPVRLKKDRVWIVDPLDGTREYSEGRNDWAVHVALAVSGRASAGAVALPARNLVFSSKPAFRTSRSSNRRLKMVVSRTRPPKEADHVARLLDAEVVGMGSCGAKAMAVVAGAADVYLHSGGLHEWDSCAPVVVAQASGLHCSRIDGSRLEYNQPDLYLPDLLVCRADLAPPILAALAQHA